MQIFRSIDSNSVKQFPKNPKEATSKVCGNLWIKSSLFYFISETLLISGIFLFAGNLCLGYGW